MKIASVFKSVTVAFSMYSRIPMPRFRWETEDMRYHLCFFPWVGGVIGILEYLWFLGVVRFEIGPTAATLIALSIPILVTGGFHLDGFMDTCDALSSWRTREERLQILSDPHIGAFAVIRLALFGLIYGAALSELTEFCGWVPFSSLAASAGTRWSPFQKRRKPGWPERNRIPRREGLRASFCCKEGFASPG